jgi:hypothetical protein
MLAGGQLSAPLAILKGVRAGIIEMRVATKNLSIKKNDDTARMSLALVSLGRESKMLFPSKEHQLCCDADTSADYFPSPSKRPEFELARSKSST